jgi:hypothetical protein
MGRRFPEAILAMAAAMVLGLLLGPLAPPAAASPLEQRQAPLICSIPTGLPATGR